MKIIRETRARLIAEGWQHSPGAFERFRKSMPTGGEFGRAEITLRLDPAAGLLERVNGWGGVESTVRLSRVSGDTGAAIALALA